MKQGRFWTARKYGWPSLPTAFPAWCTWIEKAGQNKTLASKLLGRSNGSLRYQVSGTRFRTCRLTAPRRAKKIGLE